MSKVFFIIIDERDRERFRIFKLQQNMSSKDLLPWGLYNIKNDVWREIFKNDLIYFTQKDMPFLIYGKVLKKQVNSKLSTKLWGNNPRIKSIDHFLFFTEIKETLIPYRQLIKFSKEKLPPEIFPGLYEAKTEFKKLIKQKPISHKIKKQPPKLKPVTIPVDFTGSPETKTEKVTRFIRDTKKTRLLKKKYHNKCQVCNYQIPIGSKKFYSEVHHLYPLKDGGNDNFNNMIVLCPTHHAEFDYKVIGISMDGAMIIDKDRVTIRKLTIMKDHKIHQKNILFHLQELRSQ